MKHTFIESGNVAVAVKTKSFGTIGVNVPFLISNDIFTILGKTDKKVLKFKKCFFVNDDFLELDHIQQACEMELFMWSHPLIWRALKKSHIQYFKDLKKAHKKRVKPAKIISYKKAQKQWQKKHSANMPKKERSKEELLRDFEAACLMFKKVQTV